MKRSILFVLLLMGSCAAWTQTLRVLDMNTMAPLPGVSVEVGGEVVGTTDAKGGFSIGVDAKGKAVCLMLAGYQTTCTTVEEIVQQEGKVFLGERGYTLDDVVVSASKFEEKRKDIAQPIEVIRSKDLAFWNQSTTADVMQSTGNVLVQKSQLGGGSPIIRGFETNKILMVVDGVRMNNAIYRGGHLQNILTLDNATMDKVEILFGPSSTVYGSDALGGVMHFYTKGPTLASGDGLLVKANAFARYGTAAGEMTGHADVSLGGKRLGSFTSFTYSSFGDLRQGNLRNPFYGQWGKRTFYQTQIDGVDSMVANPDVNLQVGSGYTQYDILQKLLFQQGENVSHVLNVQYSTSSDIPRYDRLTLVSGGLPRFAEWYYGPQERLFASYSLSLKSDKGLYDQGRVIVAYQNIEESRHDRRFGSDNFNHRTEKLDIASLNADFSKRFGKNELRYGLEGTYNRVNSTAVRTHPVAGGSEALDTRYPDGGSSMRSAALYATHSLEIVEDKLILNDGLRLSQVGLRSSWVDTTFFPFPFTEVTQNNLALTGNLGIVYMPGADWRFTVLGSSGFRAPNVDDLSKVFESVPGRVTVPNPELGAEHTYNLDLGVSKKLVDAVTIGVNAYYTLYRDAITTGLSTFDGEDSIMYDGQLSQVVTSLNAAKAYIYGGNGYVGIDFGPHFRFVNTVNYTYGRIEGDSVDTPLDHIPPMFGRSSIQGSWKRVRAEFFVLWNGWKRLKDYNLTGEDNIDYATPYGMPAWMTLNLRASYQVQRNIQVQAAVENLLDQNYRVYASNIGAPGRNLVLTLRANF